MRGGVGLGNREDKAAGVVLNGVAEDFERYYGTSKYRTSKYRTSKYRTSKSDVIDVRA